MTNQRRIGSARRASRRLVSALALGLLFAAAPTLAQVPDRMNFQGLLLDSAGQPLNGTVDLAFALFPVDVGGSALWSESMIDVPVVDGIYDVALGSVTPLTAAVFAAQPRFLQVTVDGEVLSPRRELLVVPYAFRAETADTATAALNVGGISASYVEQTYQYGDADDNGILNSDTNEGLDDVDGDGRANFIDPDNDGDSLGDQQEIAQGTAPNLVTPVVTAFVPDTMLEQSTGVVTVTGQNFDAPGLAVVIGSQSPAPFNVTPTSFDVNVGPQDIGTVSTSVTLANGQLASGTFRFGRRVTAFVTSTTYNGDLGGLPGADAKCNARAAAASLPGNYLGWIVTAANTTRRSDRFGPGAVFELVDGQPFASSYAELVNNATHTPALALDEFGNATTGHAWTGLSTGGGTTQTCASWVVNTSVLTGAYGLVDGGGGGDWESSTGEGCDQLSHLYCFEQ